MGDHLDKIPGAVFLGKSGWRSGLQSRLYYKCRMWIEFQSISTWLRGFPPGTPVSSLIKIDSWFKSPSVSLAIWEYKFQVLCLPHAWGIFSDLTLPACKRTPSLVLIVPTIEFANELTVLHEGRRPLWKVSDFILQCRAHSVIDGNRRWLVFENSKCRRTRVTRGQFGAPRVSRVVWVYFAIGSWFRPLSYFSAKSETIGNA